MKINFVWNKKTRISSLSKIFIMKKCVTLDELSLLITEKRAVKHRLILKILASRRWQFVAVGSVNDSFLRRYNKRPRSRTKGGTRTKDERGVEAEPDERPQSVKMRNDEGTAPPWAWHHGDVWAVIVRLRDRRFRGRDLLRRAQRVSTATREIEIISRERKLEDPD